MRAENLKAKLTDDVLKFVGERIERQRAKQVEDFLRAFYANVASDDIAGQPPEDLFSAGLSLLNFAMKRSPGQPKIRVFNPEVEDGLAVMVDMLLDAGFEPEESETVEIARLDRDIFPERFGSRITRRAKQSLDCRGLI